MKYEQLHVGATVNDIPSNSGDEIGLWKILEVRDYRKNNILQKQKILIELIQKHRDSYFKIGHVIWVSPDSITFSEEYETDQQIKNIMNQMGYKEKIAK